MNIKKIILFSLLYAIIGCNRQEKKDGVSILNDKYKEMKIILINQLKKGNSPSDYINYNYAQNDLDAIVPVLKEVLKSNGFKTISNEDFNDKIKLIFNRIIDTNSETKYLYINFQDKCNRSIKYFPNDFAEVYGTFAIKKDNFISDFFAIPQIIDYQTKFPELKNTEDNKITVYDEIEKIEINIPHWKDEPNLNKQRQNNIQTLVNRNKYLFNDNKASLVWLKFNDEYFLESLVKIFGYVEDKDLLKWVLDRSLNDNEFDKVLFTKTCDNKYIFHKEVFEVINLADTKSKEKYITFLKKHFPKIDETNSSEEIKIQALYCYYSTKLFDETTLDFYDYFPRFNDEESEAEFKKNNYYNLPDFKELYKKTRYGSLQPAE